MTEENRSTPALTDTLDRLASSIDRLNFRSVLQVVSTVLGFIMLVVVLYVVNVLRDEQASTNRILTAVESVTSEEARSASRENLNRLVTNLLGEITCEIRRHEAGLPAAEAGKCRQSTAPQVYPGTGG